MEIHYTQNGFQITNMKQDESLHFNASFYLILFLLFILFFMFAFSDSFGLRIINNPSNSSYHNYSEPDKQS